VVSENRQPVVSENRQPVVSENRQPVVSENRQSAFGDIDKNIIENHTAELHESYLRNKEHYEYILSSSMPLEIEKNTIIQDYSADTNFAKYE